jgi:hypothetical protein
MVYGFRTRTLQAWIITCDESVIRASESMQWAFGRKTKEVMKWAKEKELSVYVGESETNLIRLGG